MAFDDVKLGSDSAGGVTRDGSGEVPRRAEIERLPGPDVVRAVALIGVVVMNYHGYLIIRGGARTGGWAAELFDPWTGPLSTRFAATFVLVAGVGVTLLTRRVWTPDLVTVFGDAVVDGDDLDIDDDEVPPTTGGSSGG